MLSATEISIAPFTLPPQACDCHMHVFGDQAEYPLAPFRSYSVEAAPLADYLAVQQRIGLRRNVFVQASGYHTDNRCMLDALASRGGAARGVAVVEASVGMAELQRMHGLGVRGVRLNLVSVGASTAQQMWTSIEAMARLLVELGWHMQFFVPPAQLPQLSVLLRKLPIPAVLDHMGLPNAGDGLGQAGFAALLELLGDGRCWVKLSGADRVTRGQPDMTAATGFMRALVRVNPDYLVWGSDWPHIGWHSSDVHAEHGILPFRSVDEGELLAILADAVPDTATRNKILVTNPARLYDF